MVKNILKRTPLSIFLTDKIIFPQDKQQALKELLLNTVEQLKVDGIVLEFWSQLGGRARYLSILS